MDSTACKRAEHLAGLVAFAQQSVNLELLCFLKRQVKFFLKVGSSQMRSSVVQVS